MPKLWFWLRRVLIDYFLIMVFLTSIYFLWIKLPFWLSGFPILICLICIGARQHAIAILGHDGAHRLICRNKYLNDILTTCLCFGPLGFLLGGYRRFHFEHHRKVGTHEDPELKHKNHFLWGQWDLPFRWSIVILHLIGDLCGGAIPHLVMAYRLTKTTSFLDQLGVFVVIGILVFMGWYFGFLWAVGIWFLCLWTTFWAMFRIRIWTEHVGTLGTHIIIKATWWQKLLFLPHNTWCHWYHHEGPAIPCWKLPECRVLYPQKRAITVGELFRELSFTYEALDNNHIQVPAQPYYSPD